MVQDIAPPFHLKQPISRTAVSNTSTSVPYLSIDTTIMATTHPTDASPAQSAQQQLHLQIHVSISASSPTLNLATRTKFSLTITFTLINSPRPIALFKASSSPLLQPLTALTSPGLALTCNARTGAAAPRPAFFHGGGGSSSHPRCRLGRSHSDGDDSGPPYPHEKPLAHLHPGGVERGV